VGFLLVQKLETALVKDAEELLPGDPAQASAQPLIVSCSRVRFASPSAVRFSFAACVILASIIPPDAGALQRDIEPARSDHPWRNRGGSSEPMSRKNRDMSLDIRICGE
jgi:hypothetical protein